MKKKILFGILAVILLAVGFIASKFYGSAVSTPSGEFFYIKTGSNYEDVRNALVEQKYISSPGWFDWGSKILKYNNIKPGRYKITKGMSLVKLIRMLRAGNQVPVNFVITKIRTKETLAGKVGSLFETDSLQMINFLNNPDSLRTYGLDTVTVMAAAIPLTYSINWNSAPDKIFSHLHQAYENFWTDERKKKAEQLDLTPVEVVTMASIIDEETNKKADRPNIASVYLNRIRNGMPLQADPTIKFAMRNFGLKRILHVHLETPSPYNTYLNKGLPPGPICTPSPETVDAVLNSPKTDYIYFVASHNFDGSHIFTTNYDDHLKYARLYQKELTVQMKIRDSLNKAAGK